MAEIKKVPAIRFRGLIDTWDELLLGSISEIKTGPFGSSLHAEDYVAEGEPIITTEHFKQGELPKNKSGVPQVSKADYERLKSYLLKSGDIVFSRVGSIDINAHVRQAHEGWLFSGRVLRVRTKETIDSEYLHHELFTNRVRKNVVSRAVGQTMPSINTEILKDTLVNLPQTKAEQTQIGSYFQHLDKLISLHQTKVNKLTNLKKAMLEKMFPKQGEDVPEIRFKGFEEAWEERPLLDNLESVIDFRGRTPKKLGMDWSESGYLALSALNVKNGFIDKNIDAHYGNQELYDKWMHGSELHKHQVLMTTEAPMGNVAQIPDNNRYILSQRTIAFVVVHERITENFLAVSLSTDLIFRKLTQLSSGGTAKGVSQKSLSSMDIFVPKNTDEQTKIGSYFKKLDELLRLHQIELEKLGNLKKACLEKMFV